MVQRSPPPPVRVHEIRSAGWKQDHGRPDSWSPPQKGHAKPNNGTASSPSGGASHRPRADAAGGTSTSHRSPSKTAGSASFRRGSTTDRAASSSPMAQQRASSPSSQRKSSLATSGGGAGEMGGDLLSSSGSGAAQLQQQPAARTQKEVNDAMQQKCFTRWWNSELPPEAQLQDVITDLAPGVAPNLLLEKFLEVEVAFTRRPKNRIKMIENLFIFLKTLKSVGIRSQATAEDILEGHRGLILFLTWRLVVRFVAQVETGKNSAGAPSAAPAAADAPAPAPAAPAAPAASAPAATLAMGDGVEGLPVAVSDDLLRWLGANCNEAIVEWESSLINGRAFSVLLNTYDRDAIRMATVPPVGTPDPTLSVLQNAFDIAESEFQAPRLLQASDFAEGEPSSSTTSTTTTATSERRYDLKSMQLYVLKLRQALHAYAVGRRRKMRQQCDALLTSVENVVAWATDAKAKLMADTKTVEGLNRTIDRDVFKAERMLNALETGFRGKAKPDMDGKRQRILNDDLPNTQRRLLEFAAADARVIDSLPEGLSAAEVAQRHAALCEERRAKVDEELRAAVEKMEASWRALDEAEVAYDASLWLILVEKKTDILINDLSVEAGEAVKYMRGWATRFNNAPAHDFGRDVPEFWASKRDSAAALRDTLSLLHDWTSKAAEDAVPGASQLRERLKTCLKKHTEVVKRRSEENRKPPEDYAKIVNDEWTAMTRAAQLLRAKVVPLMEWQEQQLKEGRSAFVKVNRRLDEHFMLKDTHSAVSLKDSITRHLLSSANEMVGGEGEEGGGKDGAGGAGAGGAGSLFGLW